MTYTGGRNQLPDNERSTSSVCDCKHRHTHQQTAGLLWAGRFSTNNCPHTNTAATHHHSWLYSVCETGSVIHRTRGMSAALGLGSGTTKPAYEVTRDQKRQISPPPRREVPLHTGTCSLGSLLLPDRRVAKQISINSRRRLGHVSIYNVLTA